MDDQDQRLLERFKLFDLYNSGYISLEELRICTCDLDALVTNSEVEEMLKRADTSADGQVSYEEFVELFHNLKSKKNEQVIPMDEFYFSEDTKAIGNGMFGAHTC